MELVDALLQQVEKHGDLDIFIDSDGVLVSPELIYLVDQAFIGSRFLLIHSRELDEHDCIHSGN